MELQIIAFYFFTDNFLKSIHFYEDPQTIMSTAEIITATLTAAQFFVAIIEKLQTFLKLIIIFLIFLVKVVLIVDFTASPLNYGNKYFIFSLNILKKLILPKNTSLTAFPFLHAIIFEYLEVKFYQVKIIMDTLQTRKDFFMDLEFT